MFLSSPLGERIEVRGFYIPLIPAFSPEGRRGKASCFETPGLATAVHCH